MKRAAMTTAADGAPAKKQCPDALAFGLPEYRVIEYTVVTPTRRTQRFYIPSLYATLILPESGRQLDPQDFVVIEGSESLLDPSGKPNTVVTKPGISVENVHEGKPLTREQRIALGGLLRAQRTAWVAALELKVEQAKMCALWPPM